MNGKQCAMGTLCAMVLLTMAFIPVSHQPAPYDPWADMNEDGKIDIKDLAYTALRYGTLGDPTKTVYVKRMTYSWSAQFSLPRWVPLNLYNDTRGYDRFSIYVRVPSGDQIQVNIYSILYDHAEILDMFGVGGSNPSSVVKTYQVQSDQINIWMENSLQPYDVTVKVGVYATA